MTLEQLIAWVVGMVSALTGINLPFAIPVAAPQPNLTAEQVVDLEVEAEQEFIANGGQY